MSAKEWSAIIATATKGAQHGAGMSGKKALKEHKKRLLLERLTSAMKRNAHSEMAEDENKEELSGAKSNSFLNTANAYAKSFKRRG